jgi:hypothetical protein
LALEIDTPHEEPGVSCTCTEVFAAFQSTNSGCAYPCRRGSHGDIQPRPGCRAAPPSPCLPLITLSDCALARSAAGTLPLWTTLSGRRTGMQRVVPTSTRLELARLFGPRHAGRAHAAPPTPGPQSPPVGMLRGTGAFPSADGGLSRRGSRTIGSIRTGDAASSVLDVERASRHEIPVRFPEVGSALARSAPRPTAYDGGAEGPRRPGTADPAADRITRTGARVMLGRPSRPRGRGLTERCRTAGRLTFLQALR